jgi:hypothetical protein
MSDLLFSEQVKHNIQTWLTDLTIDTLHETSEKSSPEVHFSKQVRKAHQGFISLNKQEKLTRGSFL